jgi:phosphatidylglycerophosphate synthase
MGTVDMTKYSSPGEPAAVAQPDPSQGQIPQNDQFGDKRLDVAFALCFFLGFLGAHRFYVGKHWTGILMLVTVGGLLCWNSIDTLRLAFGEFRDRDGKRLRRKSRTFIQVFLIIFLLLSVVGNIVTKYFE